MLVFPGLFRGALDEVRPDRILPDVLDERVVPAVGRAVSEHGAA